ncbi:MAG: hypothetical protein AAB263_12700 [Planctomycetota bacterium]
MSWFVSRLVLIVTLSINSLFAADGTLSSRTLDWQGTTRTYKVWVPNSVTATPGIKHPIVIALHGGGGNSTSMRNIVKAVMEPLASADAWLIVYPDAIANNWNDDRPFLAQTYTAAEDAANSTVDDVGFLGAIADALAADPQLNGDSQRLFRHRIQQWRLHDPDAGAGHGQSHRRCRSGVVRIHRVQ